jgi:hypothetical protein
MEPGYFGRAKLSQFYDEIAAMSYRLSLWASLIKWLILCFSVSDPEEITSAQTLE